MNKVTIIGAGRVGSTIAYTLAVQGLASEIVLIDINTSRAEGEAVDIRQGTPYCNPCEIYAGDYNDAKGSNIVIITSGIARKPGQTRIDLAQTNVNIMKSIIPSITKAAPDAYYIVVSNPVDILTYTLCKYSGLPESRLIGSGTILDTARLRSRLSEHYKINTRNIHAYVLGEHGESSFIPWSLVNISNVPIKDYRNSFNNGGLGYGEPDIDEIDRYVKNSGAYVIERKAATYYAIATSTTHICKCLLSGIDTTLTVSTMCNGEYGIDNVCISLLNIVGHNGAHCKVLPKFTDEELVALQKSVGVLKDVIKVLKI